MFTDEFSNVWEPDHEKFQIVCRRPDRFREAAKLRQNKIRQLIEQNPAIPIEFAG